MKKESIPNALINETSPYLLQHAYNPVNWYPWGETALRAAREQNKLILVSIGYSACHWCHVMERECFEDEEVAALMNRFFINLKVDREERPDIDQIYMSAVQLMNNGRGGWPLNCFTLPDGRPIYGGTYFPKSSWIQLLQYLASYWNDNYEKAIRFGQQVSEAVQHFEFIESRHSTGKKPVFDDVVRIYTPMSQSFDLVEGGTDKAPKFPLPVNWKFILHFAQYSNEPRAEQSVRLTLDKMARGGIYDQIGGGFARYATDHLWFVPHFEKMLYDNAQLVELYAEAWKYYHEPLYEDTVHQTIACLMRDFRHPAGAFYSAYDADSEGHEGKYYVWTAEEIKNLLGQDADVLMDYYSIVSEGNWEHRKNILYRKWSDVEFVQKRGLSLDEWATHRSKLCKRLLEERFRRVAPGLDDKILLSWNALAIKALLRASQIFCRQDWQISAMEALGFLLNHLTDGLQLYRSWKNGKASINGFADDYAFLIEALLEANRSTFDPKWALLAQDFMDYTIEHFTHNETGLFYYTSDLDPPLIARKQELYDNVIPSANASLAHSLKTLGWLFDRDDYTSRSSQMLDCIWDEVQKYGASYAYWADLVLRFAVREPELVFVGPDAIKMRNQVLSQVSTSTLYTGILTETHQLPIVKNRWRESGTWVYVCHDSTCKAPTDRAEHAIELIHRTDERA